MGSSNDVSERISNLHAAQRRGIANRPAEAGFPYLAEAMRQAGVRRNEWQLPSMQSTYWTQLGPVVEQGVPLLTGAAEVPSFDEAALIAALRADQAGRTSFPEFAAAAWRAGVVRWAIDLEGRVCTYHGCDGEGFVERYAAVALPDAAEESS